MSKITVTYLSSRRFVSQPFVDALNLNGIPSELVFLSGGTIERSKKTIRSTAPFVVVDTPYLPSIILVLLKKAGMFKGEFIIRLRGDAFIEMQSFNTPFLRTLTAMSMNSAISILPVAKYLEERIKKTFERTGIYTIYNGVDTDFFSPRKNKKKDSGKITITTVMNLSIPEKLEYIDKLPQILTELSKDYDLTFNIAGGGNYLTKIKKRFSKTPCANFLGPLSREGIADLLSASDIFFYPTSLDILPNAVLEASAMGLPVVSTDVGGISEIIKDSESGFLFKNFPDCKSKLKTLIEDETLRKSMGKNGRKRVIEKFSWPNTTQRFVDYMQSIIGEK